MTDLAKRKQDRLMSAIESALAPGCLIRYHGAFEFISDLNEVEEQIASLVSTDPDRAVQLYETFMAGCHDKAEEVDDSDGELGTVVQGLFCGWIRARQAANADAGQTVEILQAKKHYAKAGLLEEWDDLVELVRAEHSRKSSFMPGFEQVVAGETTASPSFAERTRRRWTRRGRP